MPHSTLRSSIASDRSVSLDHTWSPIIKQHSKLQEQLPDRSTCCRAVPRNRHSQCVPGRRSVSPPRPGSVGRVPGPGRAGAAEGPAAPLTTQPRSATPVRRIRPAPPPLLQSAPATPPARRPPTIGQCQELPRSSLARTGRWAGRFPTPLCRAPAPVSMAAGTPPVPRSR